MKSYFYKINGNPVVEFNYDINWVGDLMYYDWPLVSVVKVEGFDYPFIKAWIDTTPTKERHLLFGISRKLLQGYLIKEEPYLELFKNAVDDYYFVIDSDLQTGEAVSVISCGISAVNNRYFPKSAVLLDYLEEEEIQKIANAFSLELSADKYLFGDKNILSRAKTDDTDLINLHLTSHNDTVGYGTMRTNILGLTLVYYTKMAEAAALKVHAEQKSKLNHGDKWASGERDNVISFAQTRIYAEAASFDIFLQPIRSIDKEKRVNPVEDITQRIFELFRLGEDVELDAEIKSGLTPELLYAYENFLKVISDAGIRASMQYGNPHKDYVLQHSIDGFKAEKILRRLKSINVGKQVERKLSGRFTAIDITKKTFGFITINNHMIIGNIDKSVAEAINSQVNFSSNFEITLKTHYEKRSSKGVETEKNILVGCKPTRKLSAL